MKFEWDRRKAASNLKKHSISFELVRRLDWGSVVEIPDFRHAAETRIIAWGLIDERLHVLVYTMRGGIYRVISLRKANNREAKAYEQAKNQA